jgi:predicted ATPase
LQINKIKGEHIDTGGDQKEYYTRLTDTLRTYLEERFGIKAMEMTTGEIMERLRLEEDQSKIDELRDLLETADLVKFAKHTALLNERDRNMASVIEFIEATKSDETATVERVETSLTDSEKRSQRSRHIIVTLIAVLSLLAAALLCYVVWHTFSLIAV